MTSETYSADTLSRGVRVVPKGARLLPKLAKGYATRAVDPAMDGIGRATTPHVGGDKKTRRSPLRRWQGGRKLAAGSRRALLGAWLAPGGSKSLRPGRGGTGWCWGGRDAGERRAAETTDPGRRRTRCCRGSKAKLIRG